MMRLVLAGTGSGVGKTCIASGLMLRLAKRYKVQPFKVGPDFIDPMFHALAAGRPSRNLDSFMIEPRVMVEHFRWACQGADLALIEGVRGLYDGLTATGDVGSTAEIAKLLDAPVVLVVNARSLAKSAAAVVLGFRSLDPRVRVAGAILNNVSGPRHRQKATEAVERLAKVPVLGAVERGATLSERHLGLVTVDEHGDLGALRRNLEEMVEDIDLERLLEIGCSAPELSPRSTPVYPEGDAGLKVAVPRDRSFCFYYPENLEALSYAGATVEHFRPTDGDPLPEADLYYLGGGYPEVHARRLSENEDFLQGLGQAAAEGKAIYAECGGLMTLCSSIVVGEEHRMAGVFPFSAELTEGRQGLSYVQARGTPDNPFFPGLEIRGHEFHYSVLRPTPCGPFGYEMLRGTGIDGGHDGLVRGRVLACFMHQHSLSCPDWGPRMLAAAMGPGANLL
jgi:cobyrinic acid a,c-diamide synthase